MSSMLSLAKKVFILFGIVFSGLIGLFMSTSLRIHNHGIKTNFLIPSICKMPNLPLDTPELTKFIKKVPKISCSKAPEDWIRCKDSYCFVDDLLRLTNCNVQCNFTDIIRVNDFKNKKAGKSMHGKGYGLKNSDLIDVSCRMGNKSWSSILTGIRNDEKIYKTSNWKKLPPNALHLNVLMFGLDSVSRNTFIRQLPKSYKYLIKELKADVLQGYNIVGDGTPQALIPILTGQTELELPDTRKRMKYAKFVNTYPFIWKDYKKMGYVTAFFEDVPETGIFTYRLKGFDAVPTDHYMRPYYLSIQEKKKKWPKLCAGRTPRHMVMLNLIKDFFNVYKEKPKFLFGFHGELSHDDYNLVSAADDDIEQFLKELKGSGALNNTVLIVMADHGSRFGKIRNTIQGKLEERLPFFSFAFPEWFKNKYKMAYRNFKSNLNKLTTPFDIYSTLKDVLYLENTGVANITKRSLSLFSKIPAERSCFHAGIEPHWCACLDWKQVSLKNPVISKLANAVIQSLNNYTAKYRHICEQLTIKTVHWVTKMATNENVLKYSKALDLDGFVPDLSGKTKLEKEIFQIKVTVSPGDSLFEASVTHKMGGDNFNVEMSDISRINMYGRQAKCVEEKLPHLRKYCYCKE